ncbi:MAG: hypothetical protein M3680_10995 [Myxococcota bacterium]|nr:hypothetical protein [Myxococcota bacterium]
MLLLVGLVAPAAAQPADLVVLGPFGEVGRVKVVASALSKTSIGTLSAKRLEVACATDAPCLATAGSDAGARRALAIVLAGGAVQLVLVDVVDRELVARRELVIADGKLEKELPREIARFLADAPTERAKLLFAAGNRHYELGEYAAALEVYKKAYRVKTLPAFLFNIAQCHRKLGQHTEAIAMYQSYLVGMPNAPNKELVESLIAESRTRIAADQQAHRDRELAQLEADKQRAEEARKAKEAEALAEAERTKAAQAKLDAERQRELDRTYNQHPARSWTIVTGALGAAAVITGGYFGYRARNAQASFDDAGCGDRSRALDAATLARCEEDRVGGKRDALVTNVLIGGGGAVLLASVLVFVIDPGNLERPETARASVQVSPTSFQVVIPW